LGVPEQRNGWFWCLSFQENDIKSLGQPDVDVLVNAAGLTHASPFVTTTAALVEDVLDSNLKGTLWGCQVIAKNMMRQRRKAGDTSCIINVSSLLGLKGGKGSVVYAASKAGVIGIEQICIQKRDKTQIDNLVGLTRSLALELARSNIRVNAIVPGYVESQMTQGRLNDIICILYVS
jgi:NAD(P)-dependent dehydrogenase (short-subunit alcohol dehydrogenase family)